METNAKRTARKVYEAPVAEVIRIEAQTILCASPVVNPNYTGNSTESVTTQSFMFP